MTLRILGTTFESLPCGVSDMHTLFLAMWIYDDSCGSRTQRTLGPSLITSVFRKGNVGKSVVSLGLSFFTCKVGFPMVLRHGWRMQHSWYRIEILQLRAVDTVAVVIAAAALVTKTGVGYGQGINGPSHATHSYSTFFQVGQTETLCKANHRTGIVHSSVHLYIPCQPVKLLSVLANFLLLYRVFWDNQLTKRKGLCRLTVLCVSVHGQSSYCFWAVREIVMGEWGSLPSGGSVYPQGHCSCMATDRKGAVLVICLVVVTKYLTIEEQGFM